MDGEVHHHSYNTIIGAKNRINDQHICIWGQTINGKQCKYSEKRGLHIRYFLTFELSPDGAVDEEVDGGVDGECEMVGAGQAEVPGGPHQPLAAPGTSDIGRASEWEDIFRF